MKCVLIIELWGLGDATIMSSVLQGLLAQDWQITLLAKPPTCALLKSNYPTITTIEFDAPWTVFYGKYRLARWPWPKIFNVLRQLRGKRFDAAISIRRDPRDHLLMWLGGVKRRVGFFTRWSRLFLNEPIFEHDPDAHRVEEWWNVQDRLTGKSERHFPPRLQADAALVEQFRSRLAGDARPAIVLHCGARIAVRRWPEAHYRQLIVALGQKFDFQLVLIPDPDGYGAALRDLAQHTFSRLSLAELQALLSCGAHVFCNDSGPCHIAAALGAPVVAFFGPQRPELFGPFGRDHLVLIRDICEFRPCADYCRFPEPYCLTRLTPDLIYDQVESHLRALRRIPLKSTPR